MEETNTTIGARLNEARRDRGIPQQQVALRMGVSRARIQAIESSADVLISTLRRYAEAIGLSEEEAGKLIEGVQ